MRFVVAPLLMPTVLFLMLTTILQALPHTFVLVEVLTGGGPSDTSSNLLYDIYRNGSGSSTWARRVWRPS